MTQQHGSGAGGTQEKKHEHFPLLHDVAEGLDKHSTVGYENSVRCMKLIVSSPDNPQCEAFWNGHVYRMVQILLEQRPHLLGVLEKSCVEDTVTMTVQMMPKYPIRMDLILRIFDTHNTYYTGSRSNYQNFLGLPELRLNVLKLFAENKGFDKLREEYYPSSGPFPPTKEMLVILRALKDSNATVSSSTREETEQYVVNHLMGMSEEQLKKESTDHMSHLITQLILPKNSTMSADTRYQFWLQHTRKMMNCSSIVLKLYAWDQVNDIIREALNTKPFPLEYVVRGAGNHIVNGTYSACFASGETPKYVKVGDSSQGVPELTLFRCTMRSKMKWWFLSEADREKPGTDKDIDYYQHKSMGEQQEREPPLSGWSLSVGAGSPSVYPPPLLEARGHFIPDTGRSIDEYLISKVPAWIEEGNILGLVFGTTMHRELISRSRKLLNFLADVNALTEVQLRMIWAAGMRCHDAEISDEIQSLLGALSLHMNPSLYDLLMDLLLSALKSNEGGKEGLELRFSKVVAFVEKFHKEFSRALYQLPSDSGILFLNLVWSLYRHPLSETCKSQPVVEELLSLCLNERWNGGNVVAYITECTEQLHRFRTLPEKDVDEAKVSRTLQSLIFMLSHESTRGTDTNLATHGVSDILYEELLRFVKVKREVCLTRKRGDVTWYKAQLAKRLHLIRMFYGLSAAMNMTRDKINEMWALLSHPTEREELFVFFKEAGVRTTGTESAFVLADCMYVFKNMICDIEVDWSSSSEGMYDSFITYSDGMKKIHADTDILNLAQETIWRITLAAPLDTVAHKAVSYLLRSYNTFDSNANKRLLERVFDNLKSFDAKQNDGATALELRRVDRCISILNNAIRDGAGAVQVPHITRGCMNRIRVTVTCRIQPAYYDARTQKKASEQTVSVGMHPLSSVMALKSKICSFVEGSKPDRVYLNFDNRYVSAPDSSHLSSIGIVDGSEVIASLNLNNYATVANFDDDFEEYKDDGAYHIGNLISSHPLYFDILLSLLDQFTGSDTITNSIESSMGNSIWKIMMEIPTQPALLKSVIECSCGVPPKSTDSWDVLLRNSGNTDSASMTYLLQIVDGLIQPANEIRGEEVSLASFIDSGGFSAVLRFFLSDNAVSHCPEFRKTSDMTALHVLRHCLFGDNSNEVPISLVSEVNASAADMVRKLLSVANFAAEGGHTGSVEDALFTLTYLLKSPDIAGQLTSDPQAKSFVTSVLKHSSKKVRDMAGDFAVRVGKSQKVVFEWLLAEVDGMSHNEKNCDELFEAFRVLMIDLKSTLVGGKELKILASTLSNKLLEYPHSEAARNDPAMLIGCLGLLKNMVEIDISALNETVLGKKFVGTVLSDFLFAMPTPEIDSIALCVRPQQRKIMFMALQNFLKQRPENFPSVLQQLHKLMELSAPQLRHSWGVISYHDHRRHMKVGFTGLKNQGCTCYSNSLLQQLFMNVPFRKAVMETPLRSSHRCSLWHMRDDEIVGKELMIEWEGGVWRRAHVQSFDHAAGIHVIRYRDLNGEYFGESFSFNVRGGSSRIKKETGRVKLYSDPESGNAENAPSESEDGAYRILEQLQRTFCFLEHSKQAYFDPRPLVEACKTLNLNYNVYHQNDASEFCDQLLDRLETAMRGKHTGKDVWKENVLASIFGGGMLYQKIPEECEFYEADRLDCGHWQSTREEAFLKCELIIRGKENIQESLEQLVEGELMNGDNKIMCEKCNQKKDTMRRTCFDILPNTLMVHLKRFDLDFQTFETVKLNNKIAFPNRLSMFKYTKEGLEAEEQAKIILEEGGSVPAPDLSREMSDPGVPPVNSRSNSLNGTTGDGASVPPLSTADLSDYEYDLQGVLVHAGMAQGGHYYSFIRQLGDTDDDNDTQNTAKWYRFDDEDVTNFNPDNIPSSCFGGTYSSSAGMHDIIEEDRSANALMLFYRKVKTVTREVKSEDTVSGSAGIVAPAGPTAEEREALDARDPLVNGYQAFEREVWEANMKYLVSEYVLDVDLHNFVRSILSAMCKGSVSLEEEASALTLAAIPAEIEMNEMVSFGCQFFVDVVLHCKNRSGVKLWLDVLDSYFKKFPFTADWFLTHILTQAQCSWLRDFLLHSTDSMASSTFVHLIVSAGHIVIENAAGSSGGVPEAALSRVTAVVDSILDMLPLVPLNWRTADELFIALRDLSSVPGVAEHLVRKDVIAKLAYFAIPEQVPSHIRDIYEKPTASATKDFSNLIQTVLEAIAVLLGIPQTRKVALIEENPKTLLSQLTGDLSMALTTIFRENCIGNRMDFRDLLTYMEKTFQNQKQANIHARSVLERYGDRTSAALYLEGFLQYYQKNALYNPKLVWKDLQAFGFQNDLSRSSGNDGRNVTSGTASSMTFSAASDDLVSVLPLTSRECLLKLGLYEAGMYEAEATAIAVAKRMCFSDEEASTCILKQSLNRLYRTIVEFWSTDTDLILNFNRSLLALDDGLLSSRLEEVVFGEYGYLTRYYNESHRTISSVGRHAGYPHESKMWADTYLKQFRVLCASSAAVMEWVQDHVLRDQTHAWLIPSLQKSRGNEPNESLSRKVVIVTGSGIPEIVGEYNYARIHNDACMFERDENKKYAWFISYTDDGGLPGHTSDWDFYTAPSLYQEGHEETNDILPPLSTWEVIGDAIGPAPQITIINADVEDVDSDRSLQVVDDESSSQNDTEPPALSPNDDSMDMDDYSPAFNSI